MEKAHWVPVNPLPISYDEIYLGRHLYCSNVVWLILPCSVFPHSGVVVQESL